MMSNEHTKAEFVVSSNLFELLLNLTFFIEVFFEALFKQLCASKVRQLQETRCPHVICGVCRPKLVVRSIDRCLSKIVYRVIEAQTERDFSVLPSLREYIAHRAALAYCVRLVGLVAQGAGRALNGSDRVARWWWLGAPND